MSTMTSTPRSCSRTRLSRVPNKWPTCSGPVGRSPVSTRNRPGSFRMAASTAALRRRAAWSEDISGTGAGTELAATALTGAGQAGRAGAGRVGAGTEASSDQASRRDQPAKRNWPARGGPSDTRDSCRLTAAATTPCVASCTHATPRGWRDHAALGARGPGAGGGYGGWVARAVIVGGTGAIGRAAARRLLATGWSVELTGRDPARMPRDVAAAGGRFVAADTRDAGRSRATFGDGADLLVDCVCFTAEDAARLLPLARDTASTVLISSKAVYVDGAGRHSNSPADPDFGGPVREDQPTVAPGYGDYRSAAGYPAGKVAAERVLLDSGAPVTVLRPSKIHGPGPPPGAVPRPPRGRRGPSHGRRQHRRAHRAGRRPAGPADPERRRPGRTKRPGDLPGHRPPPRAHLGRSPPGRPAGCARSASTGSASTGSASTGS